MSRVTIGAVGLPTIGMPAAALPTVGYPSARKHGGVTPPPEPGEDNSWFWGDGSSVLWGDGTAVLIE